MGWKVAHACVRGSAHVRSGLPNQDAAQCIVIPGEGSTPSIAIAAVSDGHGGARHFRSQIGSSLAVSTAVDVVQDFLSKRAFENGADSINADDIQILERRLVDHWMAAVSADLENHPLTGAELEELEKGDGADSRTSVETLPILAYGATLLVAAGTDNLILYLQLGDGEILCVNSIGETTRPLPDDARLLGNQTTSLCQPDAWQEFRAGWFGSCDMPALVLLSTDGYANSFRSDDDFLKIGSDYLEIIREQGIASLAEELPEILKEATQQGSGDDITLAILQGDLKKSLAEANGAPVKPKISNESRSALIEQLKASHSSQHRRLDELSTRLEETRKDNRRLQMLIILLVLAVAGAGLYFFRGRFHASSSRSPELKPGATAPHAEPGQRLPDGAPASPKAANPAAPRWQLALNHGSSPIILKKGSKIPCGKIAPCETVDSEMPKQFAEVAWDGKSKQMQLINHSGISWKVALRSNGQQFVVNRGDHIVLGSDEDDVTFKEGVSGTINPIVASSPAEASNEPDAPGSGDQPATPATARKRPETE